MAANDSTSLLDMPRPSPAQIALDEMVAAAIERAVRGIYTIKRLAWDGAGTRDPDDYANAIADLCQLHGKRLDDVLAKIGGASTTGLFDDDSEAANG